MAESVIRNEYGETVFVQRPDTPRLESAVPPATPQQAADRYLRANRSALGLERSMLADDAALESAGSVPLVEFASEKDIAGNKVVVYKQTVVGLDVFGARMGMNVDASSLTLESVQSSMHGVITIENPEAKSDAPARDLSKAALKKLIGIDLPAMDNGRIERQVVYRYEPDQREQPHEHEGCVGGPGVSLPSLPATKLAGLAKGQHYICDEVLFQAALAPVQGPVNWRALVEPKSGEVLYLRALVACATGLVFDRDPQTQSGAAVSGGSTNAVLNPFRTSHTLAGLAAATPQPLSGTFVVVQDTQVPVGAPPVVPNPASNFGSSTCAPTTSRR